MKNILAVLICVGLLFSFSGCGVEEVDYNTPKSEALTAQYDYYGDSVRKLCNSMSVTPEQADEIFITLVSVGMDSKVTTVSGSGGAFKVSWTGAMSHEVDISDGEVSEIRMGASVLYPEPEPRNPLLDAKIKTVKLKSGSGAEIGEGAYISIPKATLEEITEDYFKEFVETVVKDSGYNYFTIKCDDGTGIIFYGSLPEFADYGVIEDDTIPEPIALIKREADGSYSYELYSEMSE